LQTEAALLCSFSKSFSSSSTGPRVHPTGAGVGETFVHYQAGRECIVLPYAVKQGFTIAFSRPFSK
jgi:hypothetical protein